MDFFWVKNKIKNEVKNKIKNEIKNELKNELKNKVHFDPKSWVGSKFHSLKLTWEACFKTMF